MQSAACFATLARSLGALAALLCALVIAPPAARAEGVTSLQDQAAQIKTRGDAAMEAGSYADALLAYREAYVIWPQVTLLYNMGRAEERLGLYPDALKNLESFARGATPELRAKVPKLNELLAEVRSRVALIVVKSSVLNGKLLLRGRYVGSTPMRYGIPAAAGKAALELHADGYPPVVRELSLEEGKTVFVEMMPGIRNPAPLAAAAITHAPSPPLPAAPLTPTSAPEPPKESVTDKWWFWTGIAAGTMAAIAVTAVVLKDDSSAPPARSAALISF